MNDIVPSGSPAPSRIEKYIDKAIEHSSPAQWHAFAGAAISWVLLSLIASFPEQYQPLLYGADSLVFAACLIRLGYASLFGKTRT